MPILSTFFGIVIRIYQGDHNPPHFHVQYSEFEAVIQVSTGKVIKGKLPHRVKKLVNEWRKLHKEELLVCWDVAQQYKTPKKIKPLE